jgi:hypothetical protein
MRSRRSEWFLRAVLVLAIGHIISTKAHAQVAGEKTRNVPMDRDGRGGSRDRDDNRNWDSRENSEDIRRLRNQVADLEDRLRRVEDFLDRGGRPNPPPGRLGAACILTDSGFSKTFLGKGANKLDAEFEAKKLCGASVHPSYCANGRLKCEDNQPGLAVTCVLTDTGFSKIFRGAGESAIEAEANAKIECQKNVHASYCANAPVRCDASRRY